MPFKDSLQLLPVLPSQEDMHGNDWHFFRRREKDYLSFE